MISHDMIWYDMKSYDKIWFDIIWYDMIWYNILWYDMKWYHMIWYDMIYYDILWYDIIWYDIIWYYIIWYDMIWCDIWSWRIVFDSTSLYLYFLIFHGYCSWNQSKHEISRIIYLYLTHSPISHLISYILEFGWNSIVYIEDTNIVQLEKKVHYSMI